ncbi:hypothetical protein B296_00018753 [Ensete ventricosum]|uniref:Uncharacterized protein n=1 Tax=Ensete ventricosum TaxID=4639 RepID=A0A426X9W3_ENSVE|nr:hypothetical protein B296_00018753 [Ensete ventricosum]
MNLVHRYGLRKVKSQKDNPLQLQNPQRTAEDMDLPLETDDPSPSGYEDDHIVQERSKRLRRPTKSINENLEPAFNSGDNLPIMNSSEDQLISYDYKSGVYRSGSQDALPSQAPVA